MGVWLAGSHSILELSGTSGCNLGSCHHQGLLHSALQVHLRAGGHARHMLCRGDQGGVGHRGVGSKFGGDVGSSLLVGSLGSRG